MRRKYSVFSDFRTLAVAIGVALLATVFTAGAHAASTAQLAPDFTLPSRDGDNQRLAEQRSLTAASVSTRLSRLNY